MRKPTTDILEINEKIINSLKQNDLEVLHNIEMIKSQASDHSYANIWSESSLEKELVGSLKLQDFIVITQPIISEYIELLNKPVKRKSLEYEQINEKKKEIENKYYRYCSDFSHINMLYKIASFSLSDSNVLQIYSQESARIPLCISCGNDKAELFETSDISRTCLECYTEEKLIEIGNSHKDTSKNSMSSGRFIYDRVSHFYDCIRQYQGKQKTIIPQQDLDILRKKITSYGIKNEEITRQCVLMFLKELKLTKHYENTNLIYFLLTGKHIDDISHLEENLIKDFNQVAKLYDYILNNVYGISGTQNVSDEKMCTFTEQEMESLNSLDNSIKQRKNFLNSHYLLYQLLKRHRHPCRIEHFSILKSLDRRIYHDTLCKIIFNKLGWLFSPTF